MIVKVKFIPIAERDVDMAAHPELYPSPWLDEDGHAIDEPNIQFLCSFMNFREWGLVFHNDRELDQIYTKICYNVTWLNGPLVLDVDIGDETDPEAIRNAIWEKAQSELELEDKAILSGKLGERRRPILDSVPFDANYTKYVAELNARFGLVEKCPYPNMPQPHGQVASGVPKPNVEALAAAARAAGDDGDDWLK
jgi:hypothetical protein